MKNSFVVRQISGAIQVIFGLYIMFKGSINFLFYQKMRLNEIIDY